MRTKMIFLSVLIVAILAVGVTNVSASSGNGNNECPDGSKEGHFCALSVGNPEDEKPASEWANPSCAVLKMFEDEKGWELRFTENCSAQPPTPIPTEQPKPTEQPIQPQPNDKDTDEEKTATDTVLAESCNDECICIEFGPNTMTFIEKIVAQISDLLRDLVKMIVDAIIAINT